MRVFRVFRPAVAAVSFSLVLAALAALSGCATQPTRGAARDGANHAATVWPIIVDTPYAGPLGLGRCGNDGFGNSTMRDMNVVDGTSDNAGRCYLELRNDSGLSAGGLLIELLSADKDLKDVGMPRMDQVLRVGETHEDEGCVFTGGGRTVRFEAGAIIEPGALLKLSLSFRVTAAGYEGYTIPVETPTKFRVRLRWLVGGRSKYALFGIPV